MHFLQLNQQCQSTEGKRTTTEIITGVGCLVQTENITTVNFGEVNDNNNIHHVSKNVRYLIFHNFNQYS